MNLSEALKKYGGEQANATIRKRVDFSIEGREKSGKSYLALSAPGPLAFIDYDQRSDEALTYWQQKKEIIHVPIQVPKEKLMLVPEPDKGPRVLDLALHAEIEKVRSQVRDAFMAAVRSTDVRSIVVDTGDEWWELERLAQFGKMNKVPSLAYVALNSAFETLLRSVRLTKDRDINLVLTHRVKPVYGPDGKGGTMKTSRVEATGYPHMGGVVQATLRMDYDEEEAGFKATVRTCGLNPYWVGEEFTGEEVDFGFIAACLTRMTGEDEGFDDEEIRLEAMMEKEEWT